VIVKKEIHMDDNDTVIVSPPFARDRTGNINIYEVVYLVIYCDKAGR
jgi:hypothetical protein